MVPLSIRKCKPAFDVAGKRLVGSEFGAYVMAAYFLLEEYDRRGEEMTVSASHVYLYAATENDFAKCIAAADVSGIPYANCLGSYTSAWEKVQAGGNLVIAVGGAALNALYYNPCDWSNPSAMTGGRTPFTVIASGHGYCQAAHNQFVNAAGTNALDSLKLAIMMAYYAVYGKFPEGFIGLPRQDNPQMVCAKGSSSKLSVQFPVNDPVVSKPAHTTSTDVVGVYASFTSVAEVNNALAVGWKGVASTDGLGTIATPYSAELTGRPDNIISQALTVATQTVFWLSFWTVSWPAANDTFYNAGNVAGKYVAGRLTANNGKYLPNYVILDPEGYNTPATTAAEWDEFIQGWAEGITSLNSKLKPAFYCNQSQYSDYNLSTVNNPAFVAISPIQGNQPMVAGSNIEGYIAYYGSCPVAVDIAKVASWGAKYNTIQFPDSGIDCGPN